MDRVICRSGDRVIESLRLQRVFNEPMTRSSDDPIFSNFEIWPLSQLGTLATFWLQDVVFLS